MGKHFVLIHGAWHGGWVFDDAVNLLQAAGHTAEAPTYPGNKPGDDRKNITFDQIVDSVVAVLKKQHAPVILVGHSSAGFVLQSAVPQAADKIERLVFYNTFLLPDGKSQFDMVPPEAAEGLSEAAKASPDNSVPVIPPFVRETLMANDTPAHQDAVIGKCVPQPFAIFTTPVHTAPFKALDIPTSVLFCKDDTSLPPGAFLGMAQSELGDFKLVEISGGHETVFTNPAGFVKGLLEAIA
jgi:pimeloyl-ACP methyl ester carboxylesterase